MARKTQYKTRQMTELLAYLEAMQGRHVTVGDIHAHFKDEGIAVGTTTIYRNIEKLVNEGLVAKYVMDGTSSACFEYIGTHPVEDKPSCYHCKCEKCGKLIHLKCGEVGSLWQHLLESHGFEMNSLRTIFYGICEECRGINNGTI